MKKKKVHVSNLSIKTSHYRLLINKHRLTCRLGFCVHGSLECCGNPQCTQECGPSSLRESSSAAQEEAAEKQWENKEMRKKTTTWGDTDMKTKYFQYSVKKIQTRKQKLHTYTPNNCCHLNHKRHEIHKDTDFKTKIKQHKWVTAALHSELRVTTHKIQTT